LDEPLSSFTLARAPYFLLYFLYKATIPFEYVVVSSMFERTGTARQMLRDMVMGAARHPDGTAFRAAPPAALAIAFKTQCFSDLPGDGKSNYLPRFCVRRRLWTDAKRIFHAKACKQFHSLTNPAFSGDFLKARNRHNALRSNFCLPANIRIVRRPIDHLCKGRAIRKLF